MNRSSKPVLPIAALLLLLAGCAGSQPSGSPRHPDALPIQQSSAGAVSDAVGLINLWRVTSAKGESAATWLRLDVGEFQLWRECGMLTGFWRAADAHFLATVNGGTESCAAGAVPPTIGWLDSATGYRKSGSGWQLVNADDTALATLSIDGAPKPISTVSENYTKPPQITDDTRDYFREPAPLAPGIVAATPETLLGKWVPTTKRVSTDPHATFEPNGRWTGTDGCNGIGSRWFVGASGRLWTTVAAQTMIACSGAPVPGWVMLAARAGFDKGGRLLLFDASGTEVGQLERG